MPKYLVQIGKQLAKSPGGDGPLIFTSKKIAEGYARQRPEAFVIKLRRNQKPRPVIFWWV